MAVPKRRVSKARKRKRRTHYKYVPNAVAHCSCGAARLPHTLCPTCGSYKGREEIKVVQEEIEES